MVGYYPLSAFGQNQVAASIDTPLHAFLPFPHVDHLHPDWAIAIAASANGKKKLDEFNRQLRAEDRLAALAAAGFRAGACSWSRRLQDNPGCDGVLLGSHGLFTWGNTQRECYLNSIQTIDQMGEFIVEHQAKVRCRCSAESVQPPVADRMPIAASILPALRGVDVSNKRVDRALHGSRRCAGILPVRSGQRNWAARAPVARIIFCARASARCSFDWKPGEESCRRAESAHCRSMRHRVPARSTRPTTRTGRQPIRRSCAIRIHRS